MYDILYVSKGSINEKHWRRFKEKFPTSQKVENVKSFDELKSKAFTKLFWVVWDNITIVDDFNLDYVVPEWDEKYIHMWKNKCDEKSAYINGICLFPKNSKISEKEFSYRYFLDKKEIDQVASKFRYPVYNLKSYKDYLNAVEESNHPLIWCLWDDIIIKDDSIFDLYFDPFDGKYDYDRKENHVFKNGEYFDGLWLLSKEKIISKKEFDNRFIIEKKEWDRNVSVPKPYDKFVYDTYEDYLQAKEKSTTDLFWLIPTEVISEKDFNFDSYYFSHHNVVEKNTNHVFKHIFRSEETYSGISLVPKNKTLTKKEILHRFLVEKKQYPIVASRVKPYDIIFISYNEPNADRNFTSLKARFPGAKRIHGVKGIHNAHIEAAKIAETIMFWVVDGDAEIFDDFNFDHEVGSYERDIVHVWRCQNPVNKLVYGYGGVKLLPTNLTLNMDLSKPDMTTSISNKFRAVKVLSNSTAFNTDPFNTWKSAFRECVKLSSKVIDRQKDMETLHRLEVWCTIGSDQPFGEYAIQGAQEGRKFGEENKSNLEKLKKINDFDWLKTKYDSIYG